MRGVRIRWAGAAKAAAVAVGALLALQTLPALLKPPEPPPLAPDVGLPRVVPAPELRFETDPRRPKRTTRTGSAATDVISSKPRRQKEPSAPPPPEPLPYVPPPEPAPAPVPVAPPAPAPASDGSEEFAPR